MPFNPRSRTAVGQKAVNRSMEPEGRATLAMVAKAAGVSPSTVSRILNGTAKVSVDKEAAVRCAIEDLGFSPNPVARGLAGGRTSSIGVLTQTVSSPFYGEAHLGIEAALRDEGYIPLFVSGHWVEAEERKALEELMSRRVDGLIVLAGRLSDRGMQGYAKQVPMVVLGRQMSGVRVHSLSFDNRSGANMATRHLVEMGHRRIAYIAGDTDHDDAVERLEGYRDAMREAGLPVDSKLIVQGDFTEAGGMLAVNRLLDRRVNFTAIACSNDQTAIGALLALNRRNIRVPDDVSIIGFDDVAPARFSIPPLTSVHLSVYEAGEAAARSILSLLRGEPAGETLPEPRLAMRESTRRVSR
ncbi:MAG: LacI family DNA-binding transcriptional regulator [Betaproteobacteria bacterium]